METTRRTFIQSATALAAMPLVPAFAQSLPSFRYCSSAAVPRAFSGYVFLPEVLGFDKNLGFSADTTYTAGTGNAMQLLLSNQVDLANPGLLEFIAMKKKNPDLPVKLVYCQDYASSYITVVAEDSPYKKISDLKGKSIGVLSLGSGAVATVKSQLRREGVDPSAVEIVSVGADSAAYAAFKSKQVEALSLFIGTIAAMESNGANFRRFTTPVSTGGFAVTESFLAKNRALVVKALQGIALSTTVMQLNPKVAVEAYYKKYGAPNGDRDKAMNGDIHAVERTMSIFKRPDDKHQWGELTEEQWTNLIDFVGPDSGYTAANTKYSDFFYPDLIPDINKLDLAPAMKIVKNGLPA